MSKTKEIIKSILPVFVLFGAVLVSLVFYNVYVRSTPFFTTSSPAGTYMVNLTGQKERPHIFTVEVRFNVLKNGKPFWSDQYLHSGDAFDLSFEVGYPDCRWLGENILRFYHEKDFNAGKPQVVIVVNKT
ncbi:hypothetical protein BH24ACI2_BH24ACI2_11770 [soil metagenome]|jgi:hypothetical protein